jgi:hypothetical protein
MCETPSLVGRELLLHVFNTRRTGAIELSFWLEQSTRGPPKNDRRHTVAKMRRAGRQSGLFSLTTLLPAREETILDARSIYTANYRMVPGISRSL